MNVNSVVQGLPAAEFPGGWQVVPREDRLVPMNPITHLRIGQTILAHSVKGDAKSQRVISPANSISFMLAENYKQRGQWDYGHLPACTLFCLPPGYSFDFQIGTNAKLYGFSFDVDSLLARLAVTACQELSEGRARIVEISSQVMTLLIDLYTKATSGESLTSSEVDLWQHSLLSSLGYAIRQGKQLLLPNLLKEFETQPLMQRSSDYLQDALSGEAELLSSQSQRSDGALRRIVLGRKRKD